MKLTEEWIIAQAPNASAVQNGKKLSRRTAFPRGKKQRMKRCSGQSAQAAARTRITHPWI